jgi:hypothetical protein
MLRRSGFLLAAVLVAIGFALPAFPAETGGKLDDCIFVDIGDVLANPGEDVAVPIHISNVTGWGVLAFDMEICWCDLPVGLLQYLGCHPGEVMACSSWPTLMCGPCGPNCVSVTSASATPLEGEGILFSLIFHVSANAKPCMCCPIRFEHVYLYDPEDPLNVCESGGNVCVDWCDVSGRVSAWYCDYDDCDIPYYLRYLEGVRVNLYQCDESIATTYTDPQGYFAFTCLPPLPVPGAKDVCPYCVNLDYCEVPRGLITAFDAALILKYLVCMDDLDCCPIFQCGDWVYPQIVAADVNCTDVVTAYDASLVLQYVVGLLPAFPCPDMWLWYYMLCRNCEHTCPAGFGIVGVLKGDVSGMCYREPPLFTGASPEAELGIPRHFGDYVEVPVSVKNVTDVYSAQFEVDYNARDFSVIEVRAAGPASGFMSAFHAADGKLLIAMASSSSFTGGGDVAIVTFKKKHTPVPVASNRMQMTSAMLNETAPVINSTPRTAEIVRFALGPVSPNPFTEAAVITYSAPGRAGLSIGVYDVNGRLVRTVLSGRVDAGTHQVTWDGRDDAGARVARGVYFCRMNAGEFSATEKVVLLQ